MSASVRLICIFLAGIGLVVLIATAWLIANVDEGSALAGGRLFVGLAGLALFGFVVRIISRAVRNSDPHAARDTRLVRPEKVAEILALAGAIVFLGSVAWLAG